MKRKCNLVRASFRYRKRVRVGQWVALNISRQGLSVSIGRRGFTLNLGRRGVYVTLSARGTGMSYRIGAPWGSAWTWVKTFMQRDDKPEMLSPQQTERQAQDKQNGGGHHGLE